MNEKNQQVSDEQIDALIRSGLWQDEQPLTADEEKLADAAFARAMAKIDRKAKRQKRRTVLHMLDRVVRVAACLIVAVGIAFPIALANSEAFREQILQLVLSINPETGMAHVGMEPAKEEQTANVPRMAVPDGGAAKRRAATRCTAKPTMPTRRAPCALRSRTTSTAGTSARRMRGC